MRLASGAALPEFFGMFCKKLIYCKSQRNDHWRNGLILIAFFP
jgi:hypothetical protein